MSHAMVMPSDSGADQSDQGENFCVVCRSTYSDPDETSTTPCGHVFHSECFAQSMMYSRSCPLCRQNVLDDETFSLTSSAEQDNSSDHSLEIEISGVESLGSGTFQDLVGRFGELTGGHLDLYVSHQPPPSLPRAPPSPPSMPSPTPENVIQSLKLGNVSEVENMLSHNRSLVSTVDADGDTLLHLAVVTQHEYMVKYLLTTAEIPANSTNKARMTPIHYAVIGCSARLVCLLVELGGYVDAADACGRTPLMHATMNHRKQLIDLLLEKGGSANATDLVGDTALHYASRCGCFAGVKALVTYKHARVNAPNCLGETPLHLACLGGSKRCIRFLVISGAKLTNRTKTGKLPRDYLAAENACVLSV